MESIRILQDTYEKLYVLTPYISNMMQDVFPKWKGNDDWKSYCDSILDSLPSWHKREWTNFCELDLYLLLQILKFSWSGLKASFGDEFFNEENYSLFVDSDNEFSILQIRNKVAHPENMEPLEKYYHKSEDDKFNKYKKWDEVMDVAAKKLGFCLGKKLCEIHEKEKDDLAEFIFNHSTYITMNSDEWKNDILSKDVKEGIERTKNRIETQSTAAGIMAFFRDSQFLDKGQFIKDALNKYNLPTFESILDDIWYQYYGFSK